MNEITEDQAIALGESEFWKDMTPREIVTFQLNTSLLCMPFDVFHKATEDALGRPVWTHEFAWPDRLLEEMSGDRPKATLEDVMDLIPADKRILVVKSEDGPQ